MIDNRITLLGSQDQELQNWLCNHPKGHERGAIVLFRRLARGITNFRKSDRFLAVDVVKLTGDWILESSEVRLKINMRKLPEIYFRCETENLQLGFVHNHPGGYPGFSHQDQVNELNILHGLSACNDRSAFLISMVLVKGKWFARIRNGLFPDELLTVRHICVLSHKMKLHGINHSDKPQDILLRQEAAFGKPFNAMLQSLRVVVVGAGGTGSPLATLLARAGIGELIIIDGDTIEKSNLNRTRGYRTQDIGKNKAQVLAGFIDSLGLEVLVKGIGSYLSESPEALDALSSADVVFGCTDDLTGRDLINQAMYYYAQVFIDVGLTGKVDTDQTGIPYLRDHKGRVSCILPEHGCCLRCQRVVTDKKLEFEQAIKDNPTLGKLNSEILERDYYLIGGGEQAPGVGPFTSASADNAIATLMNLIRPYRILASDLRQDNIWIDFVHMEIHSNEPKDNPSCVYCRDQFLLLRDEGKYRLEIPQLGEVPTNA